LVPDDAIYTAVVRWVVSPVWNPNWYGDCFDTDLVTASDFNWDSAVTAIQRKAIGATPCDSLSALGVFIMASSFYINGLPGGVHLSVSLDATS